MQNATRRAPRAPLSTLAAIGQETCWSDAEQAGINWPRIQERLRDSMSSFLQALLSRSALRLPKSLCLMGGLGRWKCHLSGPPENISHPRSLVTWAQDQDSAAGDLGDSFSRKRYWRHQQLHSLSWELLLSCRSPLWPPPELQTWLPSWSTKVPPGIHLPTQAPAWLLPSPSSPHGSWGTVPLLLQLPAMLPLRGPSLLLPDTNTGTNNGRWS